MKNLLFVALAFIMLGVASCKKESSTPSAKKYLVSKLTDSLGFVSIKFNYNPSNDLSILDLGTSVITFTYNSQHQVIVRQQSTGAVVSVIDSFFYDSYGNLSSIHYYDNTLTKKGKATFSYDGNFKVSSILRNMVNTSDSRLSEFEYSNGALASITQYEYNSGNFKKSALTEFFAYDSTANPFQSLVKKQLADLSGQLEFFFVSNPNNARSVKLTSYDVATGNIATIDAATIKYLYNSDGLLSDFYTSTGDQNKFTVSYIQAQ
ncbi:MAG: hypothetical protein U0T84_03015 [Chitinophagales bacterium]